MRFTKARFLRRVRASGIGDRPTAPRSTWRNSYVERVIGSIRRECFEHVIVLGERHPRRLLKDYLTYSHRSRNHLSLDKDPPTPRAVELSEAETLSHFRCSAACIAVTHGWWRRGNAVLKHHLQMAA